MNPPTRVTAARSRASAVLVFGQPGGKVGRQSSSQDTVERSVGEDARQACDHCGIAADGVTSTRLASRHCLDDHFGRGISGQASLLGN